MLLYCAIQGDEASVVVEKITSMNENVQLQLKIVIEAVLKEVNCEKINMTNITNVLDMQSGMLVIIIVVNYYSLTVVRDLKHVRISFLTQDFS